MAGRSRMAKGMRMFKMAELDKLTEMVAVFNKSQTNQKGRIAQVFQSRPRRPKCPKWLKGPCRTI